MLGSTLNPLTALFADSETLHISVDYIWAAVIWKKTKRTVVARGQL